jgi:hypothetical protein
MYRVPPLLTDVASPTGIQSVVLSCFNYPYNLPGCYYDDLTATPSSRAVSAITHAFRFQLFTILAPSPNQCAPIAAPPATRGLRTPRTP